MKRIYTCSSKLSHSISDVSRYPRYLGEEKRWVESQVGRHQYIKLSLVPVCAMVFNEQYLFFLEVAVS